MKKYVLNKYRKFCVRIFLHYTDIAIFALECFILTHPVHLWSNTRENPGTQLKETLRTWGKEPTLPLYSPSSESMMTPLVNHWSSLNHASHCMTISWHAAVTQTREWAQPCNPRYFYASCPPCCKPSAYLVILTFRRRVQVHLLTYLLGLGTGTEYAGYHILHITFKNNLHCSPIPSPISDLQHILKQAGLSDLSEDMYHCTICDCIVHKMACIHFHQKTRNSTTLFKWNMLSTNTWLHADYTTTHNSPPVCIKQTKPRTQCS